MKMVRNELGISTFLSNQEYKVYEKIIAETHDNDLTPRDIEVAKRLVSRGVIGRSVKENKTYYRKL